MHIDRGGSVLLSTKLMMMHDDIAAFTRWTLLLIYRRLLHIRGSYLYIGLLLSATDRGDNRGSLPWAPSVRGALKQCRTCSNKIRLSLTFQSSFFKGLVSLYFRVRSACSFVLCCMLVKQIMHNYLTCLLRSLLARARTSHFSI